MDRKIFLKGLGVSLVAGTALSSCGSNPEQQTTDRTAFKSGTIIHSVYFWLKEDLTDEETADFLNFFEALKKVPGIASYYIGKPAPTTPRDVVDNSFAYHWLVTFDTLDDINMYETHPDHIAAAEKYSKYWTKVEVKDTVL